MSPADPPAGLDDVVHGDAVSAVAAQPDAIVDTTALISRLARRHAPLLGDDEIGSLTRRVQARMVGLGAIDDVLSDEAVTDVMVNGPGPVWVERGGTTEPTDVTLDAEAVAHLVERVVTPLGLRADRRNPLVDARLRDGSRVHIAMPPLAVDGPYVTVRRFAARTLPIAAFAPDDVAAVLVSAVRDRRNIVVSGGTGAGKTTLLNALTQHLDPGERVVTIEDAAELRLPGEHVVRLEARGATADGLGEVTIRDLLRSALRMRPDRLVIGEVRSGEALDLIQAMNTGHDGTMSTCHANGPAEALRRLETMALTGGVELPLVALRDQMALAFDVIVQVRRLGARRIVTDVHLIADRPDDPTVPVVSHGRLVDLDAWRSSTPQR